MKAALLENTLEASCVGWHAFIQGFWLQRRYEPHKNGTYFWLHIWRSFYGTFHAVKARCGSLPQAAGYRIGQGLVETVALVPRVREHLWAPGFSLGSAWTVECPRGWWWRLRFVCSAGLASWGLPILGPSLCSRAAGKYEFFTAIESLSSFPFRTVLLLGKWFY